MSTVFKKLIFFTKINCYALVGLLWINILNASAPYKGCLGVGQVMYDTYYQLNQSQVDHLFRQLGLHKGQSIPATPQHLAMIENSQLSIDRQCPGGSTANSLIGLAALGGQPIHFIGVVPLAEKNQKAAWLRHHLQEHGVQANLAYIEDESPIGQCHVFLAPDGERTMVAHLGLSREVQKINPLWMSDAILEQYSMLLSDAYTFSSVEAQATIQDLFERAGRLGLRRCLSLASADVIRSHRLAILDLLDEVDVIFGNQQELQALAGHADVLDFVGGLKAKNKWLFITQDRAGAWLHSPAHSFHMPAWTVREAIDATGAGDMFAAGILYGLAHDLSFEHMMALGQRLAAYIIQQPTAYPDGPPGHLQDMATVDARPCFGSIDNLVDFDNPLFI